VALEKFVRSVDVSSDIGHSWRILTDVEELVSWVQLVHSAKERERLKSYVAVLEDKIGPFSLRADLMIDVKVPDDGVALDVSACGRDRAINSQIDIEGHLRLETLPSGGTRLTVNGSYQVTGRATAMGAGIVRKKGDAAVEQFFVNAVRVLGAPAASS
jgi:uncharacterized protein